MNMLALLMLTALGASVEIDLAPDQPLPYIYVDDPLILELRTDEDAEATVTLSVEAAHRGEPVETTLGPFLLRGQGARWCAVRDIPHDRGFYTARVRVTIDGVVTERTSHFCRIDRLGGANPPPLYVCGPLPDERLLFALKAVAVNTQRVEAGREDTAGRIAEALAHNARLVVSLDLTQLPGPAAAAAEAAELAGPAVERWEVVVDGDPGRLAAVEEVVRESGSVAPLALVVDSAEAFRGLLNANADNYARETVLRCAPVAAPEQVRLAYRVAALAGNEEWRVHLQQCGPGTEQAPDGPAFVRGFFTGLAAGAHGTGFEPGLVYAGGLRDTLAYMNGLAHRLEGMRYAGAPPVSEDAKILLFRNAAAWLAVLWANGGKVEVGLPVSSTDALSLTDALNNPVALPEVQDGMLNLEAGELPLLLSGTGGALLGDAAETRA